jgi:hypothetical protein
MPDLTAKDPFVFYSRLHLRELTGIKASTLAELLAYLKVVPGSCIYHHTHHFLQRHQYLSPEPPNDFAYWVSESLGEDRIGELLASIDTIRYGSIRDLREKLVDTLEKERKSRPSVFEKTAPEGENFHFIKSVSIVFATPYVANSLSEFRDALSRVTVSSIYFHMFEARLRLERRTNDFSYWIAEALGDKDLASKIAKLDPYTHTLEGLRTKILSLVDKKLKS